MHPTGAHLEYLYKPSSLSVHQFSLLAIISGHSFQLVKSAVVMFFKKYITYVYSNHLRNHSWECLDIQGHMTF